MSAGSKLSNARRKFSRLRRIVIQERPAWKPSSTNFSYRARSDIKWIELRPGAAWKAVGMDKLGQSFRCLCVAWERKACPGGLDRLHLHPACAERRSGRECVGEAVEPQQCHAAPLRCRAQHADGLLPRVHRSARFRCETHVAHPDGPGAGAAAMLHARNDLLADKASLAEINSAKLVHVGLMRKCISIDEINPAARDRKRDAMRLVG